MTREAIEPYLEYVPDPKYDRSCPCTDPGRYGRSDVQQFLSCLARNNSLYIVANFGDIQPCSKTIDPNCSSDGHYQYNTNIVYDRNGILIARYHKETLYGEPQFNKPNRTEHIYFDTPFGRFGVFTCFDILFYDPAIKLVLNYNVTNIVFPTAWIDSLPFLAAIQFQSVFAARAGVNLLGANIHVPTMRFHGSGIYTPIGTKSFYYNDQNNDGKLLTADVPVLKSNTLCNDISRFRRFLFDELHSKSLEVQYDSVGDFNVSIHHDIYTFKALSATEGNVTVCQKSLCCHLEYSGKNSTERFGFGVLDDLHRSRGDRNYYLQLCALIKCDSSDPNTCQPPTKHSLTTFSQIQITENYSIKYVFPETLLADGDRMELLQIGDWKFVSNTLNISNMKRPLLSASLFGRIYKNDTFNRH